MVQELAKLFLLLARVLGVFALAPIFGSRSIPLQAKVGFGVAASLALFPGVRLGAATVPVELVPYAVAAIRESLVGLIIGYVSFLVFAGIQVAGEIIDIQMGFGMANIIDPVANFQITLMGQFTFILAMFLYLSVDGHHLLLSALAGSYEIVPISSAGLSGALGAVVMKLFVNLFVIALKIVAPIAISLFLTDVALGIVARTVPQMNLLSIGFSLKVGVGLVVTIIVLPLIISFLRRAFAENLDGIMLLMRTL